MTYPLVRALLKNFAAAGGFQLPLLCHALVVLSTLTHRLRVFCKSMVLFCIPEAQFLCLPINWSEKA
jgi:hypothetical protein